MPRESAIPIDLPSLDDLFTTQAERDEVGCEKVRSEERRVGKEC